MYKRQKLRWFAVGAACGVLSLGVGILAAVKMFRNPDIVVPFYGYVTRHTKLGEKWFEADTTHREKRGRYPFADLDDVVQGIPWARAMTVGTVTAVVKVSDGDVHLNVRGKTKTLVAEAVPDPGLKLKSLPPVGARIYIWGFLRYDGYHRWWEIHLIVGWGYAPPTANDLEKGP